MNDIRDTQRIRTLPKDLQDIANKMLEDKFSLPVAGEVEKPKTQKVGFYDPKETETHPFLDPKLLDMLGEEYHNCRRSGWNPDIVYVSPPVRAALLRDTRIYPSVTGNGEYIIMGLRLRSYRSLADDRFVFVDERKGKVVYDTKTSYRYDRPDLPEMRINW